MTAPCPPALGRGVVIRAGDAVPASWASAPVVVIDEAVLSDPGPTVATLHAAWLQRRPVVIELGVESERFRAPETWDVEPWTLDARFEPWFDRLHFLVWANTYDARGSIRLG